MPCSNQPLGMGEWWSWIKRGQLHCLRKIFGNVSKILSVKLLLAFILGAGSLLGQWNARDQALVEEILPTKEESKWLEIDWRIDLWQARKESAKSGKPIYLWEMDGHPLGCV